MPTDVFRPNAYNTIIRSTPPCGCFQTIHTRRWKFVVSMSTHPNILTVSAADHEKFWRPILRRQPYRGDIHPPTSGTWSLTGKRTWEFSKSFKYSGAISLPKVGISFLFICKSRPWILTKINITMEPRIPIELESYSNQFSAPISSGVSGQLLHRHCTPYRVATFWEISLVVLCSLITTSYTLHNEIRVGTFLLITAASTNESDQASTPAGSKPQVHAFDPGYFTIIFDPSPGILLGSCIVEGCAISSFAYRRQAKDRFQAPIFVSAITGATIFGLAWGINANIIMLAFIPWSVCFAMITSSMGHWLARRYPRTRYTAAFSCEVGEKGLKSWDFGCWDTALYKRCYFPTQSCISGRDRTLVSVSRNRRCAMANVDSIQALPSNPNTRDHQDTPITEKQTLTTPRNIPW